MFSMRTSLNVRRLLMVGTLSAAAIVGGGGVPTAYAAVSSAPGVTIDSAGWVHYTNLLSDRVAVQGARTSMVAGIREPDGSCGTSGSGTANAAASTNFREEVALDPSTCAQEIVSGHVGPGGLATLNALARQSATPTSSPSPTSILKARARPASSVAGPKSQAVAATTFSEAYNKTAWIDPLNITITSLAANIKYPLYGSGPWVYYWADPYEFPLDGWSSTGVTNTFSYLYPRDTYGWQVDSVDHFTNTDFATFIYSTLGLAGWLACGAQFTVTAHFNHNVIVQGYSNGNRGWGWNDSASGACANLVHHAQWSGFGTTS